jgi:hypothetical protein
MTKKTGFPPDLTIDSSSTQLHDAQWDFCGIEWMGPVTTLPCGCAPAWLYFIVHLCASIKTVGCKLYSSWPAAAKPTTRIEDASTPKIGARAAKRLPQTEWKEGERSCTMVAY